MLWAITSYFNPLRFSRRRRNFGAFREGLGLPLLVVEWARDGAFELDEGDADALIRLSGGDLMWQKERLLNVALDALPGECDAVAWLDADVVFDDPDWARPLPGLIAQTPVVQLFASVAHESPDPGAGPLLTRSALAAVRGTGGAEGVRAGIAPETDPSAGGCGETDERGRLAARPSSGHAWAADRGLLAQHGLYDACVSGSGDMAIALAAMGLQELFVESFPLNGPQRTHYRAWAERFAAATGGRVGWLPSTIRHLFHGNLSDRRYRARLEWLAASGFDPETDLAADARSPWEWRRHRSEREAWFHAYFEERREDDVCVLRAAR